MSSVIGKSTFIYISKYNLSLKSSLIKIVRPFLLLYHIKLLICPAKSKLLSGLGLSSQQKSETDIQIPNSPLTKRPNKFTLLKTLLNGHFTSIIFFLKVPLSKICILVAKLIIWLIKPFKDIIVRFLPMDRLGLEKLIQCRERKRWKMGWEINLMVLYPKLWVPYSRKFRDNPIEHSPSQFHFCRSIMKKYSIYWIHHPWIPRILVLISMACECDGAKMKSSMFKICLSMNAKTQNNYSNTSIMDSRTE